MHSIALVSIFAAAATLTLAAPASESKRVAECPGSGQFYVCAKNGFRGHCSSDPCNKTWCPDFDAYTCNSAVPTQPQPPATKDCLTGASGLYYVCANGFKGICSVDACTGSWCPDYTPGTCDKKAAEPQPEPPVKPTNPGSYYKCYNNGFDGHCSVDPCAIAWCPDYKSGTYEPATASAPATPSEPAKPVQTTTVVPVVTVTPTAAPIKTGNGECAAGTGYYQVCGNGFKGCCKSDACSLGYCPPS